MREKFLAGDEPMSDHARSWKAGLWRGLLVLGLGCTRAIFADNVPDAAEEVVVLADADTNPKPTVDDAQPNSPPDVVPACPNPVVPTCQSSPAVGCDPYCQTGGCDRCNQKCSFVPVAGVSATEPACVDMVGSGEFPAKCTLRKPDSAEQFDDCAPGSMCLSPSVGDEQHYCFKLCRERDDCGPDGVCAKRSLSKAGASVLVCDPPYLTCGGTVSCCDPVSNQGCDQGRICLLVPRDSASVHSSTVCEFSNGEGTDSSPCNVPRDCFVGHACLAGRCRRSCTSDASCPAEKHCEHFGSEFGCCV